MMKRALKEIKWILWVFGISGWFKAFRDSEKRSDSGRDATPWADTDTEPVEYQR